MTGATHLDPAPVDELVAAMGFHWVENFARRFEADTAARIQRMAQAFAGGDREAGRIEAHSLVSTFGAFGLTRLARLARAVDDAVRTGEIDVTDRADALCRAVPGDLQALRDLLTTRE